MNKFKRVGLIGIREVRALATCRNSGLIQKSSEMMRMVDYVKGSYYDSWHWCKNCTQYPMYIYVGMAKPLRRPKSHLCTQCKDKEDNEDCTT